MRLKTHLMFAIGLFATSPAFAMDLNVYCLSSTRAGVEEIVLKAADFKPVTPTLAYARRTLQNGDQLAVTRSDDGTSPTVKVQLVIPALSGLMVEGGGLSTFATVDFQNKDLRRYTFCKSTDAVKP